jgi:CHRD domain-containing protein
MLRSRRSWASALAVVAVCAAVAVIGGATARASSVSIVPCSGPGGGAAGLVAAVDTANASGGGTIILAPGCTYSLTSANNLTAGANGLPVVRSPIRVIGSGATIAGNSSNFRIILIAGAAGGGLTLIGITVTGGNAAGMGPAGFGGGIFNFAGTLVLNQSVVTGNMAAGAGGGIASGTMGPGPGATLTLNNSEVSWNTVPPSGMGAGGILNISGILKINNSTIDHNSGSGGGGIASGNGNGGGPGSFIRINNSVISDNNATGGPETGGAGISNGGILLMNNTQLTGNNADGGFGGGLLNHATAMLNNVSATGNSAAIGAGIANVNLQGIPTGGTPPVPALTMNNGNVTGNTASVAGGGIANVSPFGAPLGSVTLRNTQVNGNSPNNCIPVGSIAGCNDTVYVFTATLNGGNENPPVASPGAGTAKVTWNTTTNEMTVDVTFSGLSANTTASHIHCCVTPPVNAGVATTTPTFPGFPLGVTSGTYSHTFDMTAAASYNPAFVTTHGGTTASAEVALFAGLQAGQAYLNIHTTAHPGGEIRGVLQEP